MNITKKRVYTAGALVLAVLLLITSIMVSVYSKYLRNDEYKKNQVKADNFYFTVDLLGDTNDATSLTKNIDVYGGAKQEISFEVRNYFDDLRVNEENVIYSVTMDTAGLTGVTLTKNGEEASANDSTLLAETTAENTPKKAVDYYKLSLPETDLHEIKTVSVTICSTVPYAKTMTLNFVMHVNEYDILYYVVDGVGAPFAELIIVANRAVAAEKIKVDWTEINQAENVLQVDSTNVNVLEDDLTFGTAENPGVNYPGDGYLSSVMLTKPMKVMESISIYFFKTDAQKNYSTVMSGVAAENGIYTITLEEKGS